MAVHARKTLPNVDERTSHRPSCTEVSSQRR